MDPNRATELYTCPDCGRTLDHPGADCPCGLEEPDRTPYEHTDPEGANPGPARGLLVYLASSLVLVAFLALGCAGLLLDAHQVDGLIVDAKASIGWTP